MKRIDERDIMFSRMGYIKGSKQYKDYYSKNPDKKEFDDDLRAKPDLCSDKTPTFDALISPSIDANFILLSKLKQLCEGEPFCEKKQVVPSDITKVIKKLVVHYGALDCGITTMDEAAYYSKRGRHPEVYGDVVDTSLTTAIVFSVKMQQELINTAPKASACFETSKAYVDAAMVGLQLSYYIRNLGYNARCHMDGNYLLRATPVGEKAGLGQVGRNGLLITKENGASQGLAWSPRICHWRLIRKLTMVLRIFARCVKSVL
jgi:hypothetical protein